MVVGTLGSWGLGIFYVDKRCRGLGGSVTFCSDCLLTSSTAATRGKGGAGVVLIRWSKTLHPTVGDPGAGKF
jgi:hypothetical protein